jgi:drug/metabolite transporter (DMT)-like permease
VVLGQGIGIVGVGVIVGGSLRGGDLSNLVPLGAALLAASCYGIAGSYTRWAKLSLEPLDMAHGSLWAAALLLAPVAWLMPMRHTPTDLQWGAVAALGVVCTGAAYLLYFRLIRDCGPVKALSVTFLIPVFGVLWGALFLGESVGLSTLAGGGLVLLGTAMTNGLLKRGRTGKTA